MFDTDIIITNFTINNNRIINTKSNMTYNTWTMININSTIFTDRTIIFTDNSVRNTIKIMWDYLADSFAFLRLSSA